MQSVGCEFQELAPSKQPDECVRCSQGGSSGKRAYTGREARPAGGEDRASFPGVRRPGLKAFVLRLYKILDMDF
jgi:hypothetical protein